MARKLADCGNEDWKGEFSVANSEQPAGWSYRPCPRSPQNIFHISIQLVLSQRLTTDIQPKFPSSSVNEKGG